MGTVEKNRSPLVNSDGTHTVKDSDFEKFYVNKDTYKEKCYDDDNEQIRDYLRDIQDD